MNTNRITLTGLVAAVVLAGGGLFTAAQAASPGPGTAVTATTATTATIATTADATLAAELQFARDEERMARDLYQALSDKYDGALPFSRIIPSEQRHFDAVGTLLDRYGVADPAAGKQAGSYADATVQKLYDGWLAEGLVSLDKAYGVGVALEKRDIADLEKTLGTSLPADVTQVYTALLNGSQHHLTAFQAAADGQVLGQQLGQGRQNGMSPGNGWGTGQGDGNGNGVGMMNGSANGAGRGGSGFRGDCPLTDAS